MDRSEGVVEDMRERRFVVMARSMCANGRYLLASSDGSGAGSASCISMSLSPLFCPFGALLLENVGVGYRNCALCV